MLRVDGRIEGGGRIKIVYPPVAGNTFESDELVFMRPMFYHVTRKDVNIVSF